MSRRIEKQRDVLSASNPDEADRILAERRADGWQLVTVEWQRDLAPDRQEVPELVEVPFGLKVAEDGVHLTVDDEEQEAMTLMLDMLVADKPMREVADALNHRGFTTRSGLPFTQVEVFELVPRLVEIAPEIFTSATWKELRSVRKQLQALT